MRTQETEPGVGRDSRPSASETSVAHPVPLGTFLGLCNNLSAMMARRKIVTNRWGGGRCGTEQIFYFASFCHSAFRIPRRRAGGESSSTRAMQKGPAAQMRHTTFSLYYVHFACAL